MAGNSMEQKQEAFKRLLIIMDELREGCPWDRKQTLESLRHLTIEETYELGDAIIEEDLGEIKGELGDLFLHLVFYSKIGDEKSAFDVADVLNQVCEKLIHRHPHIYGDVKVTDEEEVKRNWEQLKLKEKSDKKKTILSGVPKSLPAMVKATRIQDKAKGAGFDWDNKDQVFEKLQEEIQELKQELEKNDQEKMESEFGDVLFSMINYARFLNIDPELALERTNKKFIKRFNYLEEKANSQERNLNDMSLEEMEAIWQNAKKND
jgi:XTP/dITP diphosphohydrolase